MPYYGIFLRALLVNRLDRIDLIARLLRDRPGVTAAALAEQLGVSVRSVFRDLDHLRDRGYPIEADRGRGGGLRLHPSWGLGKVLLSSEEALCTLLSLAISEGLGFPIFPHEIGRARKKIVDAFPARERRAIAPLRERILIGPPASAAVRGSYQLPAPAVMRQLQVAFVDERVIRAEYVKEDGQLTTRRVEPHAMAINWPAWYLLGYDYLRGAPRTFRFDRFEAVELDADRFRSRPKELASVLLGAEGTVMRPV
jgi:predicted DNA-binding transcriptional regulator YafY